jgi:TonB family protein
MKLRTFKALCASALGSAIAGCQSENGRTFSAAPPFDVSPLTTNPPPHWLCIGEAGAERNLARYYPQEAAEQRMAGSVTLSCAVHVDGRTTCLILDESPAGAGFAAAALMASRHFSFSPSISSDRGPEEGRRVSLLARFGFGSPPCPVESRSFHELPPQQVPSKKQ